MFNPVDKVDEWHLSRWGKFTASEVWKINASGRSSKDVFSTQGHTYIRQKAVETLTEMQERPDLEFTKSILWGRVHEEPAFDEYVRVTRNTSMIYCGTFNPLFLDYNEYSGGSPDSVQFGSGETIDFISEVKCPKNSYKHFDYLCMKNQYELKNYSPEYYAQVQFLLLITKGQLCHFVSFDCRFKDRNKRIKIIEVKPDRSFHAELNTRLGFAQTEKLRLIEQLNS